MAPEGEVSTSEGVDGSEVGSVGKAGGVSDGSLSGSEGDEDF